MCHNVQKDKPMQYFMKSRVLTDFFNVSQSSIILNDFHYAKGHLDVVYE